MFAQNRQLPAIEKMQVLEEALIILNRADRPWDVIVKGNAIIARWKWEDRDFFAPRAVSEEIKRYALIVVLVENCRWREVEEPDGTGEEEYGFGREEDCLAGEDVFAGFEFDTKIIKTPVHEFLKARGWKKACWFS